MTLLDYKLLSLDECIELLYRHGVYIGKRKEGELSLLLYQLDSFYVEVFYRKHRCHIQRLHCFSSTALLDPYLHDIDVDALVYTG